MEADAGRDTQEISVDRLEFEMPIILLRGDVEQAAGFEGPNASSEAKSRIEM